MCASLNGSPAIRASSGGFAHVKALGLPLTSRALSQVSMNLTDFEATPLHVVYERILELAGGEGVKIAGSEIIGLIPRKAIEGAAAQYLKSENFRPDIVLEQRVAEALQQTGTEDFLESVADPASSTGGGAPPPWRERWPPRSALWYAGFLARRAKL
jgi:Glutamate formiminotransferase